MATTRKRRRAAETWRQEISHYHGSASILFVMSFSFGPAMPAPVLTQPIKQWFLSLAVDGSRRHAISGEWIKPTALLQGLIEFDQNRSQSEPVKVSLA